MRPATSWRTSHSTPYLEAAGGATRHLPKLAAHTGYGMFPGGGDGIGRVSGDGRAATQAPCGEG
jgi:hypothetical protein